MDISGTRGKIAQQKIERSPLGLMNHLFQCIDCHGAAPQQGVGGLDKETDGHEFDVHGFGGNDSVHAVFLYSVGQITFDTEHFRL